MEAYQRGPNKGSVPKGAYHREPNKGGLTKCACILHTKVCIFQTKEGLGKEVSIELRWEKEIECTER